MQSRRMFCRVAFVLLGVLPLMATLLYAGWRNHQYDAERFSDLLGRSFGCAATVRQVQHAGPGSMRLVGVELCDSEKGRPLLSFDVVSLQRTDGVLELSVPQSFIHASSGDQVLAAIHERILMQPALLSKEIRVELGSLQFEQSPEFEFIDSKIELRRIEHGTELRAALVPTVAIAGEEPVDITIRRDLSQNEQTTVLLKTWSHALPTNLILGQRNWMPRLSSESTFRGNIECHLDETGWSGDVLGGSLNNVDLDTFLGTSFGGWVHGLANFEISKLEFESDRIRELNVDVSSPFGQIAAEQLRNAIADWQLVWERDPGAIARRVAYRDLSLGIDLKAGEMRLRGRGEPKSTLLRLESGEGLQTSGAHVEVAEPVPGILSVLFGASSQIAESAEAEFLRRVLPLPTVR